jgi:hypothetical protein
MVVKNESPVVIVLAESIKMIGLSSTNLSKRSVKNE